MGVMRPELIMKSIIPVIMAGIVGIYGLVVSVVISQQSERAKTMERYFLVFLITSLIQFS